MKLLTSRKLLATSAITLLALTACASPTAESNEAEEVDLPTPAVNQELADRVPDEIKDRGSIVMHTPSDFPPVYFYSEDNEVVGFSIDMGNAIGETLGLEVDWQVSTFDNMIPGLEADRYDLSMGSPLITNLRMETLDMASVIMGASAIGVPIDKADDYPDRLSLCGTSLAVVTGNMYQETAEALAAECEDAGQAELTIDQFPSQNDAINALVSGRVDVSLHTAGALFYARSQQPEAMDVIGTEFWPEENSPESVAMLKGSELSEVVRDTINALIEDGTYEAILEKWDLAEMAIEESELNPEVSI